MGESQKNVTATKLYQRLHSIKWNVVIGGGGAVLSARHHRILEYLQAMHMGTSLGRKNTKNSIPTLEPELGSNTTYLGISDKIREPKKW